MIKANSIFNKNTLNIFTDSSLITKDGVFYSCAGSIAVLNDIVIDSKYELLTNSTNNRGEIYAILLGVYQANLFRDKVKRINLFSDSLICVNGLNRWIFSWIENMDSYGTLINSSGEPVANQDVFHLIISLILSNDIQINIYHMNGHYKVRERETLSEFTEKFKKVNGINDDMETALIEKLIYYNNIVDKTSRDRLKNNIRGQGIRFYSPIIYYSNIDNIAKYKRLLGLK